MDKSQDGRVAIPRNVCPFCLRMTPSSRSRRRTAPAIDPRRLWRPRPAVDTLNSLRRTPDGALLKTSTGALAKECCCDDAIDCETCPDMLAACCDCEPTSWHTTVTARFFTCECMANEGPATQSLYWNLDEWTWEGCLTRSGADWSSGDILADAPIPEIYSTEDCTGAHAPFAATSAEVTLSCIGATSPDLSITYNWVFLTYLSGPDPAPINLFTGCSVADQCIDGRTPIQLTFSTLHNCRWYSSPTAAVNGVGCSAINGIVAAGELGGVALCLSCCRE